VGGWVLDILKKELGIKKLVELTLEKNNSPISLLKNGES
jgi:hypothetical protein